MKNFIIFLLCINLFADNLDMIKQKVLKNDMITQSCKECILKYYGKKNCLDKECNNASDKGLIAQTIIASSFEDVWSNSEKKLKQRKKNSTVKKSKITGAFGMKFGTIYDTNLTIATATINNDEEIYQFEPKKSFSLFKEYYVATTPKQGLIYMIIGLGMVKKSSCENEKEVLSTLLMKKYQQKGEDGYKHFSIHSERNSIRVECKTGSNSKYYTDIQIVYTDGKLYDLAKKENLEIQTKNVDFSSL